MAKPKEEKKKTAIGVNFPAGTEHIKAEIEKRAESMHLSASMYVFMLLERHIKSGETFTVSYDASKEK